MFGPVTAVGDIHGADTLNYTKAEKETRGKLASCYRLADIYGWAHGLDGYITVSYCSLVSMFICPPSCRVKRLLQRLRVVTCRVHHVFRLYTCLIVLVSRGKN